jgi:uncharacterized protein YqfB (UPF0267 family)
MAPIKVVALYEYTARDARELSMMPGDILEVVDSEDDWYKGSLNGVTGYFPKSYVGDLSEVK